MLKPRLKFMSIIVTIAFVLSMILSVITYASNQIDRKIVVFNKTTSSIKKEELLKKHGASKIKDLFAINGVVVNLPKGNKKLKDEKEIAYIEDDVIVSINKKPVPTTVPTPAATPTPMSGEVIPWGIEYMGAPQEWGTTNTDNVKVGIVDTGIDLNHPDLAANIKGGFNALRKNKTANDDNGHGTHVAGIIAAAKNGFGVVGMVPDADLYAIKVLNSNGNGYVSDIVKGIDWAIKNKMNILNMSFGTVNNSQSLHDIIIQASNAGIILVAAAGNNYGGACEYPAIYPEVVSVGAIDKNGNIASFSAQQGVDVYAPGVDIFSTYIDSGYIEMDGTSMACPHVIYTNLKQ